MKEVAKMIPYFVLPIYPVLVMAGIITGLYAAHARAAQLGLSRPSFAFAAYLAVAVGLPTAHVLDVLAYHWSEFIADPRIMVDPSKGWSLSSFGGFIPAVIAVAIWCRCSKRVFLPYVDCLAVGIVAGFVFGRMGCFLVHDHVGTRSNFLLATKFPGGARHDLGLYECVFFILLSMIFAVLFTRRPQTGLFAALTCVTYGPVRFSLDFLRATDIVRVDVRYYGLTPAQYCSIPVAIVGLWLVYRIRHGRAIDMCGSVGNIGDLLRQGSKEHLLGIH